MGGLEIALAMAAASAAAGGMTYLGQKEANSANATQNANAMKWQFDIDQWNMANQRAFFNETMDYNREQANLARTFAQYNANTTYQRARSDMLAAGLNPILAYAQGGAPSPTVPAASVGTPNASVHGAPSFQRMENALGPAVSSAMQAANAVMSIQQVAAQVDQTKAQTALTGAQEAQSRSQAALNAAQTVESGQRAGLIKGQRAESAMMPALRAAQTSAASAQAAESSERAITEPRRRPLIDNQALEAAEGANRNQAQAGLARSQARFTETQDRQREQYGPPGPVSSTVGGISQIWNNITESARQEMRRWLR